MDCAYNIITANFSGGKTHATTARVYQWSRGIELCITGADNLPQTFKAHFSVQKKGGVATTIVGIDERVDVPNVLFTIGKDIHVWLGASETEDDAEILYTVDIPVAPAPMPEYYDAEDTGVFDAVVEQVSGYAATATAAANSAGASATAAAGSASAAAASASSAAGSAGAAEQARANAVTAKGQAETAAQTATEKALQTAQNASQAALDAGRAESAAGRAESAEAGAGAAKTAAEAAAQSAAASAATADEKATLAGQSATAAARAEQAAAQSAASIEGDVQIASQKASEAQTAAGQAVAAKDAAVTAQTAAETAATNAGQSASTATTKAAEAAQSASGAAASETAAEAAATRAEQAAATLTVDSALSDTSVNPVQNKVITAEVAQVKNAISEFIYTEPTLPTPDNAWIRYSNGERVGSSATRLFVFNASGIKRIKAFLTSDTPVLCAIAFYTSDGISTSGYMASDSVDFLRGIHNDGAWYETSVPDGCITIAITSKVPSASVAEYKILFAMDYAIKSDVVGLSAEISELNSESLTPNMFDDLEWYRASYVRYSDGARIGSGTYLRTYYFSNNGVGRRVKATLYCGDTVPAIIAFYSTETLDTSGYLKSASVQAKAGWATYEADIPAECKLIVFTHRNDYAEGSGEPSIQFLGSDIALNAYLGIDTAVQTSENAVATATGVKNLAISRVLNALSKPCYDHLFVNELGDSIVIPHESVYHVRLSNAFGFSMIEANPAPTSDGVYVVNHLISGKFGGYFHHVDGTTDISDIALNTVTWAWVQENVRYNSQIPKYRTRPCRLEEFLAECKANDLIPFLGRSGDANVVAIADHIMGKGRYVAYDGGRTTCPDGVLYSFKSDLTTKEDILNYCETKGKPFAYGLGNVNSFTDAQLQEIVDLLHANGYWIGVSYADSKWYKYAEMGFDFNGTQRGMNRIECGNLHNISSIFGFGDYAITGATETDGVLTFSEAGNIWPRVDNTTYNVCAIDLEMVFSGSITLYPIGEMKSATGYNSDGSKSVFVTIPIINGSPYFHIVAAAGTIFYDLNYKASVLS